MGVDIYIYYDPPEKRVKDEYNSIISPRSDLGSSFKVLMSSNNSIMNTIFPDSDFKISENYLIDIISVLSKCLSIMKYNHKEVSEALCFCSYLLSNESFPCWVDYTF